ncbi:MAG: YezD family protein [Pirellulales bacterium]|nr:YezD family protein [Pirellulales bacterium]
MSQHTPRNGATEGGTEPRRHELPWDQIRAALEGLQFGHVSVIVQDGVVVQIERTERRRLRGPRRES